MQHIFETYIHSISSKFSYEETSEMGYRTDFEILLKGLFQSINVKRIDHDARSKSGNKPDFKIKKRTISPIPNNYEHAFKTIIDFTQSHKEPIKSGEHLAKIMGGKAQRMRDNLLQF